MLRSALPLRGVLPLPVEGSGPGSAPATFGPFRVLHQLGAGTLGPVFRAHDPAEGRLVAIKAFRLDLTPEQAAELAGELEALAGRGLNHPSVAAPLAAGVEGATPWLATTYIPAESLDTAVRQYGPAPIAHVVAGVAHLAGALDFAAVSGVLHGSLHPRDVLVAPDEMYLIDVGVAPALERCGLRLPVRRPYTAPERVAGGPATRASDIYALAAIAFELLTGSPISGPDDAAGHALPDIAGADMPELRELFGSALATDPASRPATALSFASGFKAALGSASFRATPAVSPRRTHEVPPALALFDEEPAPIEIGPPVPSAPASVPPAAVDPSPKPPGRLDDVEFRTLSPGGPVPTSRSSTPVPLVAALVLVGLVAGFGLGWLWVARGTAPPTAPVSLTDGSSPSDAGEPAGDARIETEDVVAEPPESAPPAVSVPEPAAVPEDAGPPEPSPTPPAAAAAAPPARETTARAPRATAPESGRLLVRSTPAGATVQVNGRDRGRTPLSLDGLPLGGHTVVVTRPGYRPERRRVTLTRSRATQALRVPLRAVSSGTEARSADGGPDSSAPARNEGFAGSALVESRPTGARVFVDGKEMGRTPLLLADVRAGSHVVRLELEGHRTWTASVRVVAGERRRVAASLEELTR